MRDAPIRTLVLVVSLVLTAFLAAACGEDGPGDTSSDISVTGTDGLAFEPDSFSVPAGEEVTVELTSEGSVEHDFVIEEIGDEEVAHADPGETATGTFTIDEPGTYTVYCSVPGHRAAGMEAELEVAE